MRWQRPDWVSALIWCWLVLQIFTGWVLTLLFACAICSLFVALGVNSPNRQSIDQIIDAQEVRSQLIHLRPACGGQAFRPAAAASAAVSVCLLPADSLFTRALSS